ncbi:hypothetical protein SDC9_153064 [bioreactor metagenome]|uniref:Uncharacterized protein n=1 Tax=bioreactor metagenome TaxID=1076179 RepID=A0A645EUV5_9ZZZZ
MIEPLATARVVIARRQRLGVNLRKLRITGLIKRAVRHAEGLEHQFVHQRREIGNAKHVQHQLLRKHESTAGIRPGRILRGLWYIGVRFTNYHQSLCFRGWFAVEHLKHAGQWLPRRISAKAVYIESGKVSHDHAQRDAVRKPRLCGNGVSLEILVHVAIQIDDAALHQLHQRDGKHGLTDRSSHKRRLIVDRCPAVMLRISGAVDKIDLKLIDTGDAERGGVKVLHTLLQRIGVVSVLFLDNEVVDNTVCSLVHHDCVPFTMIHAFCVRYRYAISA